MSIEFSINKILYYIKQLFETFISRINITMHEHSPIDKLDYYFYNGKSMV